MKANGAKRALRLQVGGAFHSPLMQPAAEELQAAILKTDFHKPFCPIYQNVDAQPHTEPEQIRQNLLLQLTSPVLWTQSVKNMVSADQDQDQEKEKKEKKEMTPAGNIAFYEFGPGDVLKNLIRKTAPGVSVG